MRRHPLSIPLRAVARISLVEVATMVAVGAFGDGGSDTMGMVLGGLVGVAVLVCMYAVIELVRHVHFEYNLTTDTLDIASGVFSRRERNVPLGRVQTLDISQGPLARVVGLAELDIETAGGGETEASLKYVSEGEARRLQNEVQWLKRDDAKAGGSPEATTDAGASETEAIDAADKSNAVAGTGDVLFELPTRDLLLVSAIRLNLRPLVPIAVAVIGAVQVLPGRLAGLVAGDPGLGALVIALATLAAGPVATFARYYDFRLRRVGDELRYERGLLNRYTGSVPLEKIQTLLVRENRSSAASATPGSTS